MFWPVSATDVAETGQKRGSRGALPLALPTSQTVSKIFPREATYSLPDQLRRSSRAINAMLAQSWARRRYRAAFVTKVNEALGEAMEMQSWRDHTLECEYITLGQHRE